MILTVLLIVSTVLHHHVVSCEDRPEVVTSLGKIKGIIIPYNGTNVTAYLGVPFATAPVGKLRFKRPEPVKPWSTVKDAGNFPPACPQFARYPFPWYDNQTGQSEDCLYLNIYVPLPPRQGRTVIYWIFGGGFTYGSNRLPVFQGQALAAAGDVIVVTVNYRLGPLGFFYSGSEDAPGNVGIYDVLLGLKWVNEHIEAFGGDKNSITISGQSAGGAIVSFFTLSPLAKGLFKRAVMSSLGPFFPTDGGKVNLDLGQKLAKHLGCANDTVTLREKPQKVVECLRGINAHELVRVTDKLEPLFTRTFRTVPSDPIVGYSPGRKLKKKDFHITEVYIGNVKNECTFYMTTLHPDVFGFLGSKNTLFNKSYGENLLREDTFSDLSNSEAVITYYLGNSSNNNMEKIREQVGIANSDFTLICPAVYFAELLAEQNISVYYYFFTKRPTFSSWAPWMGTVHFDDMQYTFGLPTLYPQSYGAQDVDFSKKVMKAWTDFAKTGNPGDNWPLYNKQNHKVRVLNGYGPDIDQQMPNLDNCNFLRPYSGL